MQLKSKTKILLAFTFFLSCLGLMSFSKNILHKKTYVFDWRYSLRLQEPTEISYTEQKTIQTSRESEIIFAKIMTPVFSYKKDGESCVLSAECEEIAHVAKKEELKLIILNCSDLSLAKGLYQTVKKLPVVSITLIDNRRWRIEYVSKDGKIITVEFPDLKPNIDAFCALDEKYGLSKKYSNIDLRFHDKLGILNNQSSEKRV